MDSMIINCEKKKKKKKEKTSVRNFRKKKGLAFPLINQIPSSLLFLCEFSPSQIYPKFDTNLRFLDLLVNYVKFWSPPNFI